MDKRSFLKSTAVLGAAALVMPGMLLTPKDAQANALESLGKGPFKLPKLPYGYDAFEATIDKQTMELHHTGHHQAYVDNLNDAVKGTPAEALTVEAILKNIKKYKDVVRNNAGGHWNHTFWWETITPEKTTLIGGLNDALKKKWTSVDLMKAEFTKAALGQFGSGWAWLCVDSAKQLFITSTPNQDNPLMDFPGIIKGTPILALDVWEHAYYLKYHEKRRDYVTNFWNIVNWNVVEQRYQEAIAGKEKK